MSTRSKTPEEYRQLVSDKTNNTVNVLTEYRQRNQKIKFVCNVCTYTWKAISFPIKECPSCAGLKLNGRLTKSIPLNRDPPILIYKRALKKRRPRIMLIGPYISRHDKALHRCGACETEIYLAPSLVLAKECIVCQRKTYRKYTPESYRVALMVRSPTIECWDEYINSYSKLEHKCTVCEKTWECRPLSAKSHGIICPFCNTTGFSQIALAWLQDVDIDLQTAHNGGEYRIPKTRYFVDGYDWRNKIVYEFLGDCWHGNLDVYESESSCHPFNDKTAQELYDHTFKRLHEIKERGYVVNYIWENDYKDGWVHQTL